MEAVVLAGGQGTRLRRVVPNLPKSLAPIGKRPFLSYLLGWLRDQGITEIILAVGYRRKAIVTYYAKHQPQGIRLRFSVEGSPLGTGGAVRNLVSLLGGTEFLALNGDSIFDVDLGQMVSFHRRHHSETTLALASPSETMRYGTVVLNRHNRIKAFLEKQTSPPERSVGREGPQWISGGIYIMNKAVFRHIRKGRKMSLEKELFPRLIESRFYGFPWNGYFIDIGVPEDYWRAQQEVPGRFTSC